mmetsp:Transcript_33714/g.100397  ORF Transcript_33714/g.100397 Transcript_33714/m.100397 type:complete len:121 (-) Transcript_33714:227-589(-)
MQSVTKSLTASETKEYASSKLLDLADVYASCVARKKFATQSCVTTVVAAAELWEPSSEGHAPTATNTTTRTAAGPSRGIVAPCRPAPALRTRQPSHCYNFSSVDARSLPCPGVTRAGGPL